MEEIKIEFPPETETINIPLSENTPITLLEPHWAIDTKLLHNFIRLAKIVGTMGRDVVCKAIHFRPLSDNTLDMISTDGDVYIKVNIPVNNKTNLYMEPVNIPTEVLENLLKLAGPVFIITKKGKHFHTIYTDGEIPFDTFTFPVDKFNLIGSEEIIGTVSSTVLTSYIKNVGHLISASVLPQEKRVLINSNGAFVSHIATLMKGEIYINGDMDLKMRDMNILRSLLPNDETVLTVKKGIKFRYYIYGPNFMYSFLSSASKLPEKLINDFNAIVLPPPIQVNCGRLLNIADLSANLMSSVGLLGLRIENNVLIVEFRSKSNEIKEFKLPGLVTNNISTFSKYMEIQAKLLRLVLLSFVHKNEVNLFLLGNGLLVKSDELQTVIFL